MVKAEAHKTSADSKSEGVSLEVEPGEVVCMIEPPVPQVISSAAQHSERSRGRLWVDGARRLPPVGDKIYELRDAEVCRERPRSGWSSSGSTSSAT
jgi:hypothetical protein